MRPLPPSLLLVLLVASLPWGGMSEDPQTEVFEAEMRRGHAEEMSLIGKELHRCEGDLRRYRDAFAKERLQSIALWTLALASHRS